MGKKQHYVPQFYLRGFSADENRKLINLYNITRKQFFRNVAIKNQAYRPNFYGSDGKTEFILSRLESLFAVVLKDTYENMRVKDEIYYNLILLYLVLGELRSEKKYIDHNDMFSSFTSIIEETSGEEYRDRIRRESQKGLGDNGKFILSSIEKSWMNVLDLGIAIISNDTQRDFITSDFPTAKYNFFLERKKYIRAATAISLQGLVIFLPLTPKVLIVAYDKDVYRVTKSKITSRDDVDSINKIQILNSNENLFYHSSFSEKWITKYISDVSQHLNTPRVAVRAAIEENRENGLRTFVVVDDISSVPKEQSMLIALEHQNRYAGLSCSFLSMDKAKLDSPLQNFPARPFCLSLPREESRPVLFDDLFPVTP